MVLSWINFTKKQKICVGKGAIENPVMEVLRLTASRAGWDLINDDIELMPTELVWCYRVDYNEEFVEAWKSDEEEDPSIIEACRLIEKNNDACIYPPRIGSNQLISSFQERSATGAGTTST